MKNRAFGRWQAGMALVVLAAPGCLVKETAQTIYLERDGSVTWTIVERDVRSDGGTAGDRAREEASFSMAARAGRHPVALALERLDPLEVRTTIVRGERPYGVITAARFARIDALMARFIEAAGLEGVSTMDQQDGIVTWTFEIAERVSDATASESKDDQVDALADGFDGCRFVLSTGHFTHAVGFELSEDRQTATIHFPDETKAPEKVRLQFSLTWAEHE